MASGIAEFAAASLDHRSVHMMATALAAGACPTRLPARAGRQQAIRPAQRSVPDARKWRRAATGEHPPEVLKTGEEGASCCLPGRAAVARVLGIAAKAHGIAMGRCRRPCCRRAPPPLSRTAANRPFPPVHPLLADLEDLSDQYTDVMQQRMGSASLTYRHGAGAPLARAASAAWRPCPGPTSLSSSPFPPSRGRHELHPHLGRPHRRLLPADARRPRHVRAGGGCGATTTAHALGCHAAARCCCSPFLRPQTLPPLSARSIADGEGVRTVMCLQVRRCACRRRACRHRGHRLDSAPCSACCACCAGGQRHGVLQPGRGPYPGPLRHARRRQPRAAPHPVRAACGRGALPACDCLRVPRLAHLLPLLLPCLPPRSDFDPFSLRMELPGAVAALERSAVATGGTAYVHCTGGARTGCGGEASRPGAGGGRGGQWAPCASPAASRACRPRHRPVRAAGLGRAPATSLAYMWWFKDWHLEDAYEHLTGAGGTGDWGRAGAPARRPGGQARHAATPCAPCAVCALPRPRHPRPSRLQACATASPTCRRSATLPPTCCMGSRPRLCLSCCRATASRACRWWAWPQRQGASGGGVEPPGPVALQAAASSVGAPGPGCIFCRRLQADRASGRASLPFVAPGGGPGRGVGPAARDGS